MEDRVTNTDPLPKLLRQFEDAADSTVEHRREAEQARDYRDGKQWTAAEVETLRKRQQPVITDNRIADKIEYLQGLERRTRTDPKAYPRNPADEGAAEAATDAIRYVFDCNDWQQVRSAAFEQMLVEGVAVAEVVRDGEKDRIRKIRWDRFYADPHSMELDYSDALYLGIVAWFDETRLVQKYPEHKAWLEGLTTDAQRTYVETFDDKPNSLRFIDVKRRRIQVFEHYWWDAGQWKRAVFCKGGFLEEPMTSPYVDADGAPECPIVAQACYRDRNGNPYGVVRRYKDLQDEINKRRSKALHLLSTQRIVGEKGIDDPNELRRELHKPDGVLLYTPGLKMEVQSNMDLGMAQLQLLADAMNALNATGPNQALQGNTGSISGRAKQVDQEGGSIQIGALFDQIRHFQKRIARATWSRIKQFWVAETWIRVTDDEQKLKFIGLNVPVTAGEQQVEQMKAMGLAPEEMRASIMQIAMDPMSQVPVAKKNDVATMHVDIIIEEAPDTVTLQQEQFALLVELVNSKAVQIPPDVLIEASALRNKQKLIEKLKGGGELTPEQQQMQQQAMALQQRGAEAEIAAVEAKAHRDHAEAEKTTVEAAVMVDQAANPVMQQPQGGNGFAN